MPLSQHKMIKNNVEIVARLNYWLVSVKMVNIREETMSLLYSGVNAEFHRLTQPLFQPTKDFILHSLTFFVCVWEGRV